VTRYVIRHGLLRSHSLGLALLLAACGVGDEPDDDTGASGSPATPEGTRAMALPGPAVAGAGSALCRSSAADAHTAEAMARACGNAVEVESERSEYEEVYVESSGNRTIVTSPAPQRARRRDGTWGPIDATLHRLGDELVPVATVADVRFSTGGTGPFAAVTTQGHSFTLSWPTPLPAPTVSGASATFAEVLRDVDLVVTATDTGFTHLLVVKTARAAADPAVRQARYRVGGDATLTITPGGGLAAEVDGVRVVSADPPVMWDTVPRGGATVSAVSDEQAAADAPAKVARVETAIAGGDLILRPAPSMLDDPAARFPLVIDPLYVTGHIQWAYASADNQNGPMKDNRVSPGDPSPAAVELYVGNDPETTHQYRGFMRFPISGLAGKQILSAKIAGRVDHTWKCGSNRPTYFFRSDGIAAAPRQSWPGPALRVLLGNNNVHANETSCGEPNVPFEVSTAALINDLQLFTSQGTTDYFIAISAGEDTSGRNETNGERWMRYFLSDFKLHVTFNTKPTTPTALTVDGKPCVAGPARPVVKTATPTLRAQVADADGDSLEVWFAWAKWNGATFVDEPGSGNQRGVPSGGTALFNVTGNVDGGIYTFRVQSNDSPSHTPFLASEVTHLPGNCEWQVDLSPPSAPVVSSDIYKEGPIGCPGGACGSVGQTGRFTISSSADTQSFLWGLSDPPTQVLTPATLGGSVTLDWTPAASGPHTLFVRAIDRAGNERNNTYQFVVAAQSTALARWLLNDPGGTGVLVDDTGNENELTLVGGTLGAAGRIVAGPDGFPRSAMQTNGSDDGAVTAGPVLADTSKSFSVAAWVKLADNQISSHIIDQGATITIWPSFLLQYAKILNAWKLTAPLADGSAFPGVTATSTPRLNTWTHLTGTYDSAAREMKIYVNGVLESTATGITVRTATAGLRIGHAWTGAISDIQLWNRVISAAEVFALSDPLAVGNVGEWHMDDLGFGPAFDASGMDHDLTFHNGAFMPPAGSGRIGSALRLDGVDDYAAPDSQVLHTDQSFTVSAWVRPTTRSVDQTFISQESTGSLGGFALKLGSENGGVWKLVVHASATDTDLAHATIASAPALNVTTAYHHLVGVFDAQKLELRLYVDGVLAATTAMNALWRPWSATGRLLIGRHHSGPAASELTAGDVDEVRVYQGVVTDATRIP
jgi:Concanavalin A-like lectin/glucanases superfamily